MESDEAERDRQRDEAEAAPPPPRNPFAGQAAGGEDDRPVLIESKRTAAISGVVVALILALLVGCACIAGSIAFAG